MKQQRCCLDEEALAKWHKTRVGK